MIWRFPSGASIDFGNIDEDEGGDLMSYGFANSSQGAMASQEINKPYTPLTIRAEISAEIAALTKRIETKKEMLELLDANPGIEKFIDLSRK